MTNVDLFEFETNKQKQTVLKKGLQLDKKSE
jgi:hypothetical protein